MRVLTDQKRQFSVRKMLEQAFVPRRRAFSTWRIVSAILSSSWITKSHGKNRNFRVIEESRTIQPQPITQAIAACVVPRDTTPMDLASRSLTDDQKSRGARHLHNGPRTKRQFSLTYPTRANIAQYALQRHSLPHRKSACRLHPYHALAVAMIFVSSIVVQQKQDPCERGGRHHSDRLKNSSVCNHASAAAAGR
jgi:hypothetical protein